MITVRRANGVTWSETVPVAAPTACHWPAGAVLHHVRRTSRGWELWRVEIQTQGDGWKKRKWRVEKFLSVHATEQAAERAAHAAAERNAEKACNPAGDCGESDDVDNDSHKEARLMAAKPTMAVKTGNATVRTSARPRGKKPPGKNPRK